MSRANARQVGGSHYQQAIQAWDYIALNHIGFFEGSAISYLSRWRRKNGVEDLRKAIHFIEKLIELEGKGLVRKPMDRRKRSLPRAS